MQQRTFLVASTVLLSVLLHSRVWGQLNSAWSYTPKKPEASVSGYTLVEERPGIKIYASNAKEIRAAVITPTIEWVLTSADLRCVDLRKNEVNVFPLGKDALRSKIHDLVADEAEAFMLITQAEKTFLRCFRRGQGLHETIPIPGSHSSEAPSLALSADTLAYIPRSHFSRQEKHTPLILDRRTRKWNALLPVERQVDVYAAVLVGSYLWLGTSRGLWGTTLSWCAFWDRRFPLQSISNVVPLSDGSLVVVRGSQQNTLEKINLQTGKTTPLPSPPEPTVALLTTPDGSLWQLGHKETFPGRTVNRLPAGGTWEPVTWNPQKPTELPEEKTLPDSVAAMLVCQIHLLQQSQRSLPYQPSEQTPWLQQRFWRWLGPDQRAVFPAKLLSSPLAVDSDGLAKRLPTPLPAGKRRLHGQCTIGSTLYLATSDGIWRLPEGGKWESVLAGIALYTLMPDPQNPHILWAANPLGVIADGVTYPSYVVRLQL